MSSERKVETNSLLFIIIITRGRVSVTTRRATRPRAAGDKDKERSSSGGTGGTGGREKISALEICRDFATGPLLRVMQREYE